MLRKKGFTLIELMIVVAIIAVIAAIAIPNLIQSRITSNETSAVASLVVMLSGQATFHKTDYYKCRALNYASPAASDATGNLAANCTGYQDLHKVIKDGNRMVKLIDLALFNALDQTPPNPKAGYVFMDFTKVSGAAAAFDGRIEFAHGCRPVGYERTGRHCYIMDQGGSVYMQDITNAPAMTATAFPDLTTTSAWLSVSAGG